MFDVHEILDGIKVVAYDGDEVTLDSICYKPFGQACAIESIAQYWQMDRKKYEAGMVSLKQCLSHWSIDCRCVTFTQHVIKLHMASILLACLLWEDVAFGPHYLSKRNGLEVLRALLCSSSVSYLLCCRSTFESPIEPKMVLGGYPYNSTDYLADTTSLLITLPVHNNQSEMHKILHWEAKFLKAVRTSVHH